MTEFKPSDLLFLQEAANYLESPSYLIRLTNAVGTPLQTLANRIIPERVKSLGNHAIRRVMNMAIDTVDQKTLDSNFDDACLSSGAAGRWHRLAATATGGLSGAMGFTGLAVELPLTTGIMFRSIAAIAREFGEDLTKPEARLQCVSVFSHGGPSPEDDAMDASFISARIGMTTLVRDAAEFIASKGAQAAVEALALGTATPLLALAGRIGAKYSGVVSQKLIANTLPFVGIAAGAAINNAFAGHFNSVARYHFGIRRLQRQYGVEAVTTEYQRHLPIKPKDVRLSA
jgi:hypothetical protein